MCVEEEYYCWHRDILRRNLERLPVIIYSANQKPRGHTGWIFTWLIRRLIKQSNTICQTLTFASDRNIIRSFSKISETNKKELIKSGVKAIFIIILFYLFFYFFLVLETPN